MNISCPRSRLRICSRVHEHYYLVCGLFLIFVVKKYKNPGATSIDSAYLQSSVRAHIMSFSAILGSGNHTFPFSRRSFLLKRIGFCSLLFFFQ